MLAVGAGGLGSPLALYLAAAGVGTIGLVDFDVVDASNLHRQVLFGTSDVGRPKLEAAAERLREVNPHVRVEPFPYRLTSENALEIVRRLRRRRGRHGQLSDALPRQRRLRPDGPPQRLRLHLSIRGSGVGLRGPGRSVLPLPLRRASAARSRSVLRGGGRARHPAGTARERSRRRRRSSSFSESATRWSGRLLLVDAATMRFREMRVRKNPECAVCGTRPTVLAPIDYEAFCAGGAPVVSSAPMHAPSGGDLGRRAQGQARPRRDLRARRRPRAARVGDLGSAGLGQDPAGHACPRASRSCRRRTRSSSTAAPGDAAETRSSSCSAWASIGRRTW